MATLVKRNYRTFDNLFDELFSNLPSTVGKEFGWNNPPVNIHENKDGFHLELVAPGLKKEDFKVNIDNGLLTVGTFLFGLCLVACEGTKTQTGGRLFYI